MRRRPVPGPTKLVCRKSETVVARRLADSYRRLMFGCACSRSSGCSAGADTVSYPTDLRCHLSPKSSAMVDRSKRQGPQRRRNAPRNLRDDSAWRFAYLVIVSHPAGKLRKVLRAEERGTTGRVPVPCDGAFSPVHWLIIGVIVLLVLGPERLPDAGRQLARVMRVFHRARVDLLGQISEALDPEPEGQSRPSNPEAETERR